MTTNKKSTPDYKFWSKLDGWSFKDAALLLHGIDPLEYKKVKLNTREIPSEPELKEAYKTFLIFKSINWGNARTYTDTSVVPPLKILDAATYKDIDIPQELSTHVNERYKREKEITKTVASENASNEKLTTREYRNNLKQIGYMSHIIADCRCSRYQFKINNRPNAHQITQAILDKAVQLSKETDGLKSSNRKIAQALEFLDEEL